MTEQTEEMSSIRHDRAARRFTTIVDGLQGHVDYVEDAGVMTITHTVVPDAIGGRGIAGRLVQAALEYARGAGLKVLPQCSYAAGYMDKHPEYVDLRAG